MVLIVANIVHANVAANRNKTAVVKSIRENVRFATEILTRVFVILSEDNGIVNKARGRNAVQVVAARYNSIMVSKIAVLWDFSICLGICIA
jgi:hypothetical protein